MDEQSPKQEEPTPETPSEKRGILPGKRVVLPGALYWFMEFLVVFAGVFGAFLLAEYRANREEQEQRELITQALVEEVQDLTENFRPQGLVILGATTRLDSAIQAGEQPTLSVLYGINASIEPYMWETTRASGALRLLDMQALLRLSSYHNNLNQTIALAQRFQRLQEAVLIPNADAPIDEFYNPGTHQLRTKYEWYPRYFRQLAERLSGLTQSGDSLLTKLNPAYVIPDDTSSSIPNDTLAAQP